MSGTPLAEVVIDEPLVRALLREQHPDLAALPILLMDAGWDNVMFRLGADYVIRLPRRGVAASLLANEQDWLPVLCEALPIPVPSPVRIGQPGQSYPWRWSILPWLNGHPANEAPPDPDQAAALAGFLRTLHQLAPPNAPINEVRGCPLADRAEAIFARIRTLKHKALPAAAIDWAFIETVWAQALAAPLTAEKRWIHGDLHARNVLVDDGAIGAIIDWGDITSGDVATDLAGIWALFDTADARRNALNAYGATPPEIARARGWAVSFGTILLETGLIDHPRHAAMGSDMLRRVTQDANLGTL